MAADRAGGRTKVQTVALVFGVGFLLIGLIGLVTTGTTMVADPATAPRLLGIWPVNLLHNLVHLLLGVWGLLATRSWSGAKAYCQFAGLIYFVLVIVGLVSPSGFGLVPLGDNDIWLHVVLAIPLLYFGFTAKAEGAAVHAAT